MTIPGRMMTYKVVLQVGDREIRGIIEAETSALAVATMRELVIGDVNNATPHVEPIQLDDRDPWSRIYADTMDYMLLRQRH